jgi:hypothetical protein
MNRSHKNLWTIILLTIMMMPFAAFAQSGTNSPYSQYGIGVMSDQSQGFNRGMNGLALGLRERNQINFLNPASYSSLDSLTFIFDIGASLQNTNFSENGVKMNAKNSDFEYAVGAFRLLRHVGVAFGAVPYTNVGYDFSSTSTVGTSKITSTTTKATTTYTGTGGLHQAFIGVGVEPIKGLSFGVNMSYLWGSFSNSMSNAFTDTYVNSMTKLYTANVQSYKLDFGMQYQYKLDKDRILTLGLTYGLGHNLHSDPKCKVISSNSTTATNDTTFYSINNGLKIPTSYGIGLSYVRTNKWTIGADYTLQKWGSVSFPEYRVVNEVPSYSLRDGIMKDLHKFTVGGEIIPDVYGHSLLKRIHYRAGVSYSTPYYTMNLSDGRHDGPKELSASIGFGIPIQNGYNNRSLFNISAQWVHTSSKDLITENTLRINIGITFNERWFMKWKVE